MYKFFKGLMDFLLSLIGGILLIPFMIIIAIIIKCSSKGPVFSNKNELVKIRNCSKFGNLELWELILPKIVQPIY